MTDRPFSDETEQLLAQLAAALRADRVAAPRRAWDVRPVWDDEHWQITARWASGAVMLFGVAGVSDEEALDNAWDVLQHIAVPPDDVCAERICRPLDRGRA